MSNDPAPIDAFAIDKSAAAVYEGLAIRKIEAWYAAQGFRIHVRYNEANGLEQKRAYDLVDTYGRTWEVKSDRKAGSTGNFFLEHVALDHSQADMFLIFAAGLTLIIPRETLLTMKSEQYRVLQGGDGLMAAGSLIPIDELKQYAF
jgi:hypothetical protein